MSVIVSSSATHPKPIKIDEGRFRVSLPLVSVILKLISLKAPSNAKSLGISVTELHTEAHYPGYGSLRSS